VKKPNQAPKVRIVNVGCDDDLIAPADITITADASDADGSVKSVRFFAGSTSIGNEAKAPFSVK
jgi:chitinase